MNSKNKGSAFEREICKRLSLWLTDGQHDDRLWRSAMSGGRATVAQKKGKLQIATGDICSVSEEGHAFCNKFYIECKHYKDLDWGGLVTGTGKLVQFWANTCREADRYGKRPLLIARQNRQPVVVCFDGSGSTSLIGTQREILWVPRLAMLVMLFSDFLQHAKFKKDYT